MMYEVMHRDGTTVYWETWSAAESHASYWGIPAEDIRRVEG